VGLEVFLSGEDLVEDEMPGIFAILLKEVDEVFRSLRTIEMSGRVTVRSSASLPGFARTSATTEYAPRGTWE